MTGHRQHFVGRGGSTKGRKYPKRPCAKCGMPYSSNILPQHQDQCSGDATIETAKRAHPRPQHKGRFIWAEWDHQTLHAIVEEQIASADSAFCDHAPEGPGRTWSPAELYMLDLDPRIAGRTLKKCPACVEFTQSMIDRTLRVRREIDETTAKDIDRYDEIAVEKENADEP